MKKLHLIRHAKASRDLSIDNDHDRPLTARGINDCALMATALQDLGLYAEQVLCSSARRCRETYQGLLQYGLNLAEPTIEQALYSFDVQELLEYLSRNDQLGDEVVLIGHNPALTDLCNQLGDHPLDNLPTCGYACLELSTSDWWLFDEHHSGELVHLLYPSMYR